MPSTRDENLTSACERLRARVLREPAYSNVLYKILMFCLMPRTDADFWHEVISYPEMRSVVQTPDVLLRWMVEAGGLKVTEKDGEHPKLQTTHVGQLLCEADGPEQRIARLFSEQSEHKAIFIDVLRTCVEPMKRREIEHRLQNYPVIASSEVFPSFFIESLERAGGLVWNGTWKTSQAGCGFIDKAGV